jgi:hypothetical protein
MRAITIAQPWSWAVIFGGKDVENRTRKWPIGEYAVHASKQASLRGLRSDLILDAMRDNDFPHTPSDGPRFHLLDRGGIIGVVTVTDCHRAESGCCDSKWAESEYVEKSGRTRRDIYHLGLANPWALMPVIDCPGRLGPWRVPEAIEAVITRLHHV